MMQAVLHNFPGAQVEYRFKCRTIGIDLKPYAALIDKEIKAFCQLTFQEDELNYLSQFNFFKSDYIDFLRIFKFNKNFIKVITNEDDELDIVIKGPWLHTILFEVPVLAIVSEIYFKETQPTANFQEGRKRLKQKIALIKEKIADDQHFKFSDFGTRRRFSKVWQHEVLTTLIKTLPNNLAGTSNVMYAKEFGIKPIGTMAHEYLQACQSLGPRLFYSQRFAFEKWVQEYRGELGIALADTYGTQAFLRDFDLYFCKLFDGVRQDSGDPFKWADQILAHYQKMRIDPKTKTLVFSDNLNFNLAIDIYQRYKTQTNPAFGIGTNLMNDVGFEPIQIVIKMVECNGHPVAKVSEDPSKTMCRDKSYLAYLKEVFNI